MATNANTVAHLLPTVVSHGVQKITMPHMRGMMSKTIDDLEPALIIPGEWKCPQCQFVLHKRVLSALTGTVGIDNDCAFEHCPNDGALLQQDTYPEALEEAQRLYVELSIRYATLERQLQQAHDALEAVQGIAEGSSGIRDHASAKNIVNIAKHALAAIEQEGQP